MDADDSVDVQKIGELIVPFLKGDYEDGAQGVSEPPNSQRKVEATIDLSHTEIQVKGCDKLSNTEVLDFRSNICTYSKHSCLLILRCLMVFHSAIRIRIKLDLCGRPEWSH